MGVNTTMELPKQQERQFDVALSFAGEDREYVEKVADILDKMNIKVFYDKHETITLWGKDLYTYLQDIYTNKARFTIIFCSKYYAEKLWTNHERIAAQARAFESNKEYILPARFDKTKIPGILSTIGYVNLNQYSPESFAQLIKEKIGPIHRPNFFPDNPDRLYEKLRLKSQQSKDRAYIYALKFFNSMKLMTVDERIIFIKVACHACPCGEPNEIHQDLNFLSRVLKISPDEIKQIFSRLSCLNFTITVEKSHAQKKELRAPDETLKIIFTTVVDEKFTNITYVIFPIIEIFKENCCKTCFWEMFSKVDFSPICSLTSFDEK